MKLIFIIESTGRGLQFRKYNETEMKKNPEKRTGTPEKEILYHGDVGSLQGEKGHPTKEYKRIAQEIMDEVLPDGEGEEENAPNKEWPKEVELTVPKGSREIPVTWKKTNDRDGFFASKLF